VFGLIASLLVVPYTILAWTGLRPTAISPALSFAAAEELGFRIFLLVASALSVGFTVVSWRALVEGARKDVDRREARDTLARQQRSYMRQKRPPSGPT
jgi:hypothetical protein